MYKYVAKRLLVLVPIILGVTFIIFTILSFTPGDPGRLILGQTARQDAVDKLNDELGYNRPFLVRYVDYIGKALTGDFGNSYRTGNPVFKDIFDRFPTTTTLAIFAVLTSAIIGVPIGILSAVKQYSVIDIVSVISSMLMASIPGFWLGLMMIILFSQKLGWLPSYGIGSFKNFIMPVLILAIPSAAAIIRLTRTTMLETIRMDYIRTARAKGASEKTVIWKHALKNALLPVITIVALDLGGQLGGTVIAESIFSIPGLGMLTLTAIRTKDIPVVMATSVFLAILFCVIVVLIDIIYAFLDPRIKAIYMK